MVNHRDLANVVERRDTADGLKVYVKVWSETSELLVMVSDPGANEWVSINHHDIIWSCGPRVLVNGRPVATDADQLRVLVDKQPLWSTMVDAYRSTMVDLIGV